MTTSNSPRSISDLVPESPFQVLSWRWDLAHYAAEQNYEIPPKYRDDWLERALTYVSALRQFEDPDDKRLKRLDRAIFAASRLARGDPRTIFEIECRVLARQFQRRIAACCQTRAEAIMAYEYLFYDMRSLLDAEDAVLCRIQRPERLPFTRLDLEALIREVAYASGPFMLEPALRYYDECFDSARLAGKPDPTPRLTRKFADKVEFHIWGLDPAHSRGILVLYQLMLRAERSTRPEAAELVCPLLGFASAGNPGELAAVSARPGDGQGARPSQQDQAARVPAERIERQRSATAARAS